MVKITLITATYNSSSTLKNTIESVLNQTYENIEYLIIDGNSTDCTIDIARSYESQFGGRMKIVSEPDKGIYDALNKGILKATGDVIGFLHADDFYASNDVVAQIAEAFDLMSCDVLYGDLLYVNEDADKVIRYWKSSSFTKKMLCRGWMPAHPTLYVKKEIYDRLGVYDINYKISADYNFILHCFSCIEQDRILYLPIVFVKMRVGGASNKNIKNVIVKMREDARAIKRNKIGSPLLIILRKNLSKITQFIIK